MVVFFATAVLLEKATIFFESLEEIVDVVHLFKL